MKWKGNIEVGENVLVYHNNKIGHDTMYNVPIPNNEYVLIIYHKYILIKYF